MSNFRTSVRPYPPIMADSNDVALVSDREAIAAELDSRFSLGEMLIPDLLLIILAVLIPSPVVQAYVPMLGIIVAVVSVVGGLITVRVNLNKVDVETNVLPFAVRRVFVPRFLRRPLSTTAPIPRTETTVVGRVRAGIAPDGTTVYLSLIHISEPTRRTPISYAVFCL